MGNVFFGCKKSLIYTVCNSFDYTVFFLPLILFPLIKIHSNINYIFDKLCSLLHESLKKIWSRKVSTIMPPQSISGPGTICISYHSVTVTIVLSQSGSRPEHFSTDIAWEGHSFQMIGFYVVSDSNTSSFFSTHFANK